MRPSFGSAGAVRASCSDGRILDLAGPMFGVDTRAGETWELLPR
ncbi:MAG: hypothetical protein ABIF82_04330 [Planctomycetota bacterium]